MIHHSVTRDFGYPAGPLFALIADIGSYPDYMPGWRSVRILARTGERIDVEQAIGILGLELVFHSVAEVAAPLRLAIRASDGPSQPFRQFALDWTFTELAPDRTQVRAAITIEFRSSVLEHAAALAVPVVVERVVDAVERRAAARLGVPAATAAQDNDPTR